MATEEVLTVELIEKEIVTAEIIEKEIISVELSVIDFIPAILRLTDIGNVSSSALENLQLLKYDLASGYWVNVSFEELLNYFLIKEAPTKINSKRFQTSHDFINKSLKVYFNGLLEKYITIVDSKIFELKIDTIASDIIEVEYIRQ